MAKAPRQQGIWRRNVGEKKEPVFFPTRASEELFQVVKDFLTPTINRAKKVPIILDPGCGKGALLKPFKDFFGDKVETVGLDVIDYPDREGVDTFLNLNFMLANKNTIDRDRVKFACLFMHEDDFVFPEIPDWQTPDELDLKCLDAAVKGSIQSIIKLESLYPGIPFYSIGHPFLRIARTRGKTNDLSEKKMNITGIASLHADTLPKKGGYEALFLNCSGVAPHSWVGFPEENPEFPILNG